MAAALLLTMAPGTPPSETLPSSTDDAFMRTVLLTSAALELRLVHHPSATITDRRFIGFELENRTGAPLGLKSLNVHWGAELFDAASGAQLWGLAHIASPGLQATLSAYRDGSGGYLIPAGTTTLLKELSEAVRGGLATGRWPAAAGDVRVDLLVDASAYLSDLTPLETISPGRTVSFVWHALDVARTAEVVEEAKALIARPGGLDEPQSTLLRNLLADDEIAASIPVELLLEALARDARSESSPWETSADCLARLHAIDPRVRAFLVEALRTRETHALTWFRRTPGLWADDLLPHLLAMDSSTGSWELESLIGRHAPQLIPSAPEILVQSAAPMRVAPPAPEAARSWRTLLSSPTDQAPLIAGEAVIIRTQDGGIHALGLDTGASLWTARETSGRWKIDGVTPAGALVILTVGRQAHGLPEATELVALGSLDGRVAWRARVEGRMHFGDGVVAGGVVVLGMSQLQDDAVSLPSPWSSKKSLIAFDHATGAERWRTAISGGVVNPLVVATDVVAAILTSATGKRRTEAYDAATGEPQVLAPLPPGAPAEGKGAASAERWGWLSSLTSVAGRFIVVRHASGPSEISAWTAGAKQPDWTITCSEYMPPGMPMAAGPVLLVPTRTAEGHPGVQAVDGANGRVRWQCEGMAVAGTSEQVMTASSDDGHQPRLVTWRDPLSGTVRGQRRSVGPGPCVASGARLLCANDASVVGPLPDDGSPMIESTEASDASDRIAWKASVGEHAPALAVTAGIVCVQGASGALTAFDVASGRQAWSTKLEASGLRRPRPSLDGFLVGSGHRWFIVDAQTGAVNRRWSAPTPHGSVDIADGWIASVSRPGRAFRIDVTDLASGVEAWHVVEESRNGGAEPYIDDGQVIVGLSDGRIRSWRLSDGQVRWTTQVVLDEQEDFRGRPMRSGDLVLLGTSRGRVVALRSEDGSLAWTARAPGVLVDRLTAHHGAIFVPTRQGSEAPCAFDAVTGRALWASPPFDADSGAPVPWRDLLLYPGRDGLLRAVGAADGRVAWTVPIGGSLEEPVVAGDHLLVGTTTGTVVAVRLAP